ncbi:MAG: hypothetical protein QOD33_927 [Pyrinomonadaceae bacterium]|jgi:hypothetical protein|nr:hypothetical protein [Pyrinomonadaceae bacterium]
MKFFNSTLIFLFTASFLSAPTAATGVARAATQARLSKTAEREVVNSEQRLASAIDKRDCRALELLLTEYYAMSTEGNDRATGKAAALELCRSARLPNYKIRTQRRLEARAELVQITGLTFSLVQSGIDREQKTAFHVSRLWTKKDGRWLLVSQTIEPEEEETEK